MAEEKAWPSVGQTLVHRFRKKPGEVTAKVLEIDKDKGRVSVRVGDKIYPTLSAAAAAVAGHATNGWVYWGLKKQMGRRRQR